MTDWLTNRMISYNRCFVASVVITRSTALSIVDDIYSLVEDKVMPITHTLSYYFIDSFSLSIHLSKQGNINYNKSNVIGHCNIWDMFNDDSITVKVFRLQNKSNWRKVPKFSSSTISYIWYYHYIIWTVSIPLFLNFNFNVDFWAGSNISRLAWLFVEDGKLNKLK